MAASIYCIPVKFSGETVCHYFVSSDGTFENSIGWEANGIEYKGRGAKLTPDQEKRVLEYAKKFGKYHINTNNCEMFAYYVVTGKQLPK